MLCTVAHKGHPRDLIILARGKFYLTRAVMFFSRELFLLLRAPSFLLACDVFVYSRFSFSIARSFFTRALFFARAFLFRGVFHFFVCQK